MKIWLASYPRSGNTFFRNVLVQCYGIESSTYHQESTYALEENYDHFDIVKTHLLPTQLPEIYQRLPKVYLIRDGRDASVSMAHHKKDLIDIGTRFEDNLQEIIIAADDTHFSGWSSHVREWISAADIIIRYEDLVVDPIKEIEKLRSIYPLPPPDRTKLKSFTDLKAGNAHYGSGKFHNLTGDNENVFSEKNFRKGKAGSWKEEMNPFFRDLFWNYHGAMMHEMGYEYEGEYSEIDSMTRLLIKQKLDSTLRSEAASFKVLIDASKILGSSTDGVKRYVVELLSALKDVQKLGDQGFHFHIYLNGKIYDINEVDLFIDKPLNNDNAYFSYEYFLLAIRKLIRLLLPNFLYDRWSPYYRNSPIRQKLLFLREKVSRDIFYKKVINRTQQENPLSAYDLLHITLPQHATLFGEHSIKTVVTVHDVSHQTHPDFHIENNRVLAEKGFKAMLEKRYAIISVSQSTTSELVRCYGVDHNNISTIPEAANGRLFKYNTNAHLHQEVLTRYNIPLNRRYFLCLSTLEPRKNIAHVIRAFIDLRQSSPAEDCMLVIGGQKGWGYQELFAHQLHHPDIYFTGFVRDRDLSALYSGAISFCYVSHYEGFGLPILEAMSCRTPVICGENSSQIEILGAGGIAVDSTSIAAIKNAMQQMLDSEKREALAQKAWIQSFKFTWFDTAKATLRLYQNMIENSMP